MKALYTNSARGTAGRLILGLFLAVLWGGVAYGQAAAGPMHARVSFDAGGSMVKGGGDADWSYATVNTMIMPGDSLWVERGGTLEVEMSGGTFLRLADGSKADILAMPPAAAIKGWNGSFYVQRVNRSTGTVAFETPVGIMDVTRDTQVRIDILTSGATTVSVRWGAVNIRSQGGDTILVQTGQRSYIDPGYLPSEPVAFDRRMEDSFDTWNRERARVLAMGEDAVPKSVVVETPPVGLADLAPYGEWVYVDTRYYWRPTVVVDYVPYRCGYWSFVPACGYVWVEDYPFAYVTTHYGRWSYRSGYGWLWCYTDGWGPAWVATVRMGPNFVWCPLNPWDRPVVTSAEFFTVGGLQFGMYASSYCPADYLLVGPRYIAPCVPGIVRGIPPSQINIWNINIHIDDHHGRGRIPYRDQSIPVRDYSPRRVIRGLETIEGRPEPARMRVAALEKTEGRERFTPDRAMGDRGGIRTATAMQARTAQPRSVRVEREALDRAMGIRSRALPAKNQLGAAGPGPVRTGPRAAAEGARVIPPERAGLEAAGGQSVRSRAVGTVAPGAPEKTAASETATPQIGRRERASATPRAEAAGTPEPMRERSRAIEGAPASPWTRSEGVRTRPPAAEGAVQGPAAPPAVPQAPQRTVRPPVETAEPRVRTVPRSVEPGPSQADVQIRPRAPQGVTGVDNGPALRALPGAQARIRTAVPEASAAPGPVTVVPRTLDRGPAMPRTPQISASAAPRIEMPAPRAREIPQVQAPPRLMTAPQRSQPELVGPRLSPQPLTRIEVRPSAPPAAMPDIGRSRGMSVGGESMRGMSGVGGESVRGMSGAGGGRSAGGRVR